jgi:hypothetical protein
VSNADLIADVYRERNAVVFAFAWTAAQLGWRVGTLEDPADPWPVVMIDAPTGQLSWHVPEQDLPDWLADKPYLGQWDGHTTGQKYERLEAMAR